MKLPSKILNAFTLVELLIVIVIIGILMSALLPRLSGAQDIARDTSRQVALSQLQTAIMSYKALHGKRPVDTTVTGVDVKTLSGKLVTEGIMTEIPKDPNTEWTRKIDGVNTTSGSFAFFIKSKNSMTRAAGVLIARVETAGKANYVAKVDTPNQISGDVKDIHLCGNITLDSSKDTLVPTTTDGGSCTAKDNTQLRYILKF